MIDNRIAPRRRPAVLAAAFTLALGLGAAVFAAAPARAAPLQVRISTAAVPGDHHMEMWRIFKEWLFLGQALGGEPTPLAFNEVYLALQTGTIDGQDNPLPTNEKAKF